MGNRVCRSDADNVDVVDMLADLNHAPRIAVANSTGQHTEVTMATGTLISVTLAERASGSASDFDPDCRISPDELRLSSSRFRTFVDHMAVHA